MPIRAIALLILALLAAAPPASAKVILSNIHSADVTANEQTGFVMLGRAVGGAPFYSRRFTAPSAGTYLLTFTAVCGVAATNPNYGLHRGAELALSAQINGVDVSTIFPGGGSACIADDDADPYSGMRRVTLAIPVVLKAGRNSVAITTRMTTGARLAVLRRPVLVIHD